MASPIEAHVLICDFAQVDAGGKLHVIGAGWSVTSSPTSPHALAMLFKIPWDRANERLSLRLQLLDADGRPAQLPQPDGTTGPLLAEAQLETGRPAGLVPGTPLDASLAVQFPTLPLEPGRYEYRVDISDQSWSVGFLTR